VEGTNIRKDNNVYVIAGERNFEARAKLQHNVRAGGGTSLILHFSGVVCKAHLGPIHALPLPGGIPHMLAEVENTVGDGTWESYTTVQCEASEAFRGARQ
jgi:hypothetical protein